MGLAALATFLTTVLPVASNAEAAFSFVRWAGSSRWTTSVAVSQNGFPGGASTAIIANGANFPDALAAGPLAGRLGAPVLLTQPTALPPAIEQELQRLAPTQVLIVGGMGAVSADIEQRIFELLDVHPVRLAGANRFETAAAIAAHGFATATTVYVASGTSFPDALSGGPAGAHLDRPVFLTNPNALPQATADAIAALGDPEIVVLGGSGAVSDLVVQQLDDLGLGTVRRVSGANRFATSVALSTDTFAAGTVSTVYLASGLNFPDALSAAAAAGAAHAPILLTQPQCVPAQVLTEIYRLGAANVITIGGAGAVSQNAAGLVPCTPPVTPLYSFLETAANTWTRWDPCVKEIPYHVYTQGATSADLASIPAAVAAIEAASGFDFVFVGPVDDDTVWPPNSEAYISFEPTFGDPNVIGQGGFWSLGNEAYAGFVEVLTGLPPEVRHHTLIHELAHMLGLDHAADSAQVMFDELVLPLAEYADGDLEGLRLVGTTMPCLPANLTRGEPHLVTWTDEF